MTFAIENGVWPTMVTLYTKKNQIDYQAMKELINWYKLHDVNGLFAICQSSEMFSLSLEEKVTLARFIKNEAKSMQIIASGHTSDELEAQTNEIRIISDTGIDAFVLVSNRLAKQSESDDVFKQNVEMILSKIPDMRFGIYECPYPYKRFVSPSLLKWLAETGRFYFLKDTSCDLRQLKLKMQAIEGTSLKIFNANSTTLFESLKYGIHGYSGVMANFHPELYSWLQSNWEEYSEKAKFVQAFLSMTSLYELQNYPKNAKYFLHLNGVSNTCITRTNQHLSLTEFHKKEIQNLQMMTDYVKKQLLIN